MSRSEDKEIWEAYAKGVKRKKPIAASKNATSAKPKETRKDARKETPLPAPLRGAAAKSRENIIFDRKKERALRDGDVVIEARLDLHGMRQDGAYAALEKFMVQNIKAARRHLLVITGKGSTDKSVLKENLPGWLENLAAKHILAVRPAAAKHGGAGAFYVLLKKPKG